MHRKPTKSPYTSLPSLWQSFAVLAPLNVAATRAHGGRPYLAAVALSGLLVGCNGKPDAGSADAQGPGAPANNGDAAAAQPTLDDAALEKLYLRAKRKVEQDGGAATDLASIREDLQRVANGAKDPHLRANASLLLGSLAEAAGDRTSAVSYYRQAAALVPEEAAAHAVLAMALAADGKPADAIEVQQKVVELVPDDLQAWLILGELNVKAGRNEAATEVYAAYEVRRKGLIDGLTLRNKDGSYIVSVEDRIGCAANLEGAADTGTAAALVYALETDPDPKVRAEVATVMGVQRLKIYEAALDGARKEATDPELKEVLVWALSEVVRDPVDVAPGPVPVEPDAAGDTDGSDEPEGADGSEADGSDAPLPDDATTGD